MVQIDNNLDQQRNMMDLSNYYAMMQVASDK